MQASCGVLTYIVRTLARAGTYVWFILKRRHQQRKTVSQKKSLCLIMKSLGLVTIANITNQRSMRHTKRQSGEDAQRGEANRVLPEWASAAEIRRHWRCGLSSWLSGFRPRRYGADRHSGFCRARSRGTPFLTSPDLAAVADRPGSLGGGQPATGVFAE
jgi:hypothetical protein